MRSGCTSPACQNVSGRSEGLGRAKASIGEEQMERRRGENRCAMIAVCLTAGLRRIKSASTIFCSTEMETEAKTNTPWLYTHGRLFTHTSYMEDNIYLPSAGTIREDHRDNPFGGSYLSRGAFQVRGSNTSHIQRYLTRGAPLDRVLKTQLRRNE